MWEAFMAELRSTHLGAPTPGRSVFAELQAAFDRAVRRRGASPELGIGDPFSISQAR
jgi:hypothetical protein